MCGLPVTTVNLGRPMTDKPDDEDVLWERIGAIEARTDRLEQLAMSTQSQIDQDTNALQQVQTDLATAKQRLQDELDALQAQVNSNGPINLDGLNAAVVALQPVGQQLGGLTPTPAVPGSPPATNLFQVNPVPSDASVFTLADVVDSNGGALYTLNAGQSAPSDGSAVAYGGATSPAPPQIT